MIIIPKRQLDLSIIKKLKYDNHFAGLADYSKRNLDNTGRQYNTYLKKHNLNISSESVSCFLKEQGLSQAAATRNLSRYNLKKLLKHQPGIIANLKKRTLIEEVFSDIKPLRQDKKIVEYLSYNQVLELIVGSKPGTALIIEFLFHTGCRISELTSIRIRDISINRHVKIKLIGKGNKQRSVYITKDLYQKIRNQFRGLYYLFENRKHKRLDHSDLRKEIKAVGKSILHRDIHPHLLRHSTANYLLKDCGKSIKFVSEFLGHSSPAVTLEMYIHEQPGEDVVDLFSYRKREEKVG